MQPFYYRLWGKENCISLYTSYALKNEESFWITVNVDEIKDTTDYCIQRISMKIKVDLKTYVLRLTLSVVDFFLSIPFYKWDEILYIAWDLQCTKPYYWSLSKNWMFLTDSHSLKHSQFVTLERKCQRMIKKGLTGNHLKIMSQEKINKLGC